jgi:hypothetical protein
VARLGEQQHDILIITASPLVWAAHFLLCYVTAAVWCAKHGALDPIPAVRAAVAVYTALALGAIAIVGWVGFRAHRFGTDEPPHDADTPEDRHRFMGFATLLLSGLSALAVVYAALVAVFIETCQ